MILARLSTSGDGTGSRRGWLPRHGRTRLRDRGSTPRGGTQRGQPRKNQDLTPRCAAGALLVALIVALILGACAKQPAPIEVVRLTPPGAVAGPGRTGQYETDLASIVDAFEQALGLPRVDVALVLFPSRRSFEEGLLEVGYTPALARSASAFDAIGGAQAILMNAGVVNRFERTRRVRLLAHELVHSLQYQFGGGTRGASEQWLREGFAEWVACRITSHLGLASFQSLRDDLLRSLAGARPGLPPVPLDALVTFPQWVEAQRRYEAPLYAQAFIAAELLVDLHGVPALVGYFERFRDTNEHERAFADAFGQDRAEFERAFMRRWHESVSWFRVRG